MPRLLTWKDFPFLFDSLHCVCKNIVDSIIRNVVEVVELFLNCERNGTEEWIILSEV